MRGLAAVALGFLLAGGQPLRAQALAAGACEGPALLEGVATTAADHAIDVPEVVQATPSWCWAAVTLSMAEYFKIDQLSQCGIVAAEQWSASPKCTCAESGDQPSADCPGSCLSIGAPALSLAGLLGTYSPTDPRCDRGAGALSWDRLRQELSAEQRPFIAWWEWLSCQDADGTADDAAAFAEAIATRGHIVIVSGFSTTSEGERLLELMDPSGVEKKIPYEAYVGSCLHERRHAYSIHGIHPPDPPDRSPPRQIDSDPNVDVDIRERLRRQRLSQAMIDAMLAGPQRAGPFPSPRPRPRPTPRERLAVVERIGRLGSDDVVPRDPLTESRLDVVLLAAYRPSMDPMVALSSRIATLWPTSTQAAAASKPADRQGRPGSLATGPGVVVALVDGVQRTVSIRTAGWTSAVARARGLLAARDGIAPRDVSVIDCRPLNRTYVAYRTDHGVLQIASVGWIGNPSLGPTERASIVFARLAPEAAALLRHGRPIF